MSLKDFKIFQIDASTGLSLGENKSSDSDQAIACGQCGFGNGCGGGGGQCGFGNGCSGGGGRCGFGNGCSGS